MLTHREYLDNMHVNPSLLCPSTEGVQQMEVGSPSLTEAPSDVKCLLRERKCFHKPRENVKMPLRAPVTQNYSLETVKSLLTQESNGDFLSAQLPLSLWL